MLTQTQIDDEELAGQALCRTRRARTAFEANIPVVTDPTADRLQKRFYKFWQSELLVEEDEAPPDHPHPAQVPAMVENELATLYIKTTILWRSSLIEDDTRTSRHSMLLS
ncbi:hypothetical protein BDV93DRAFT_516661 [Ceratobasidium sp. AG-I]|nr:hypothetical protein BDV93DRAFT_516661 [Ceratobasidium sp. AG-I]